MPNRFTNLRRGLALAVLFATGSLAAQAQNVGIGTTAPTQTLDVNGALRVRGLSGSDTRLPVVLPDGTLGVNAPVYGTTATTPAFPTSATGSVGTGTNPRSVAVSGTTAYVVNVSSNSLQVFNVATPSAPVLLGSVATGTNPVSVAVSGTTAYVVNFSSNTLQVFNVATPSAPVLLGSVATGTNPNSVAVSGTTAYVVNLSSNTLQAFNVATPSAPVLLGTVATGSQPFSVAVSGTTAYVVNSDVYNSSLQVFNVATPSVPVLLATVATGYAPRSVAVSGTTAYVLNFNNNTLQAFNVATPSAPVLLGTVATGTYPNSVAVSGTTAYVVNSSNALQAFVFPGPPRAVAVNADGSFASVVIPSGTDFVQNGTTQQASANFNISGAGTVGGTLTASNAVVTTALTGNGASIGPLVGVGIRADGGLNLGQNTPGYSIYLGYQAGRLSTGSFNLFSGAFSGYSNTTGNFNIFHGNNSGQNNTTGSLNLFSGSYSGQNNTTGNNNHFSGYKSGYNNTTGADNLFSGYQSGLNNTTGIQNLFSGTNSGLNNTTGSNNTALGYNSGPASGSSNLTNATALGANVSLTQNNTVVLGNGANVGIGTSAPGQKLDVVGNVQASAGVVIDNAQTNAGGTIGNASGLHFGTAAAGEGIASKRTAGGNQYGLDFYTTNSARLSIDVAGRVGIGTTAPSTTLDVAGNARIEGLTVAGLVQTDASGNLSSATAASLDPTTASNGLTKTGSNFALGGTLAAATTIAQGTNFFALTGTGQIGLGTAAATGIGAHVTVQAAAVTEPGLQVGLSGASAAIAFKTDHNGSNFIVRPVSAGGTSTAIENTGGGALAINPTIGNVGIGTIAPTEKLEVAGYTKLDGPAPIAGATVPGIATALFTGNLPAGNNISVGVTLGGIDASRILSVTISALAPNGNYFPPNQATSVGFGNGYEYGYYLETASNTLRLSVGNNANNVKNSAPGAVKILVMYQQ